MKEKDEQWYLRLPVWPFLVAAGCVLIVTAVWTLWR